MNQGNEVNIQISAVGNEVAIMQNETNNRKLFIGTGSLLIICAVLMLISLPISIISTLVFLLVGLACIGFLLYQCSFYEKQLNQYSSLLADTMNYIDSQIRVDRRYLKEAKQLVSVSARYGCFIVFAKLINRILLVIDCSIILYLVAIFLPSLIHLI